MTISKPITLDQFIGQLIALKECTGGDIPVVLEGRDTIEMDPRCIQLQNAESCRLAVWVADDIEVTHGCCESVGQVAWIRGVITANSFVRPTYDENTNIEPDTQYEDNRNLNGVVGNSNTNLPPCW